MCSACSCLIEFMEELKNGKSEKKFCTFCMLRKKTKVLMGVKLRVSSLLPWNQH